MRSQRVGHDWATELNWATHSASGQWESKFTIFSPSIPRPHLFARSTLESGWLSPYWSILGKAKNRALYFHPTIFQKGKSFFWDCSMDQICVFWWDSVCSSGLPSLWWEGGCVAGIGHRRLTRAVSTPCSASCHPAFTGRAPAHQEAVWCKDNIQEGSVSRSEMPQRLGSAATPFPKASRILPQDTGALGQGLSSSLSYKMIAVLSFENRPQRPYFKTPELGHHALIKKFVNHWHEKLLCCHCCCSVAKSYLTPCDPMDCPTPGLPLLHHLLEFAQIHVHWVGDAIWASHPLPPSPFAFNLKSIQIKSQLVTYWINRNIFLEKNVIKADTILRTQWLSV